MSYQESHRRARQFISFSDTALVMPSENWLALENDHSKKTFQTLHLENFHKLSRPTVLEDVPGQNPVDRSSVHRQPSVDEKEKIEIHPPEVPHNTGGPYIHENVEILPHNILGSLEDYRIYLEAKGETELLKQIPTSQSVWKGENNEKPSTGNVSREMPSTLEHIERNALKRWEKHATERRKQQRHLSTKQDRPVGHLVMNHADNFRETQEQREILARALPHIYHGYGYRIGSEFWSLPQRYGDELSGITATLTQTELGKRKPVTFIGQPSSIRREMGIASTERAHPASLTWDKSAYLHQQQQDLKIILQEMDIRKPEISKLEVIGSGKPLSSIELSQREPLERMEEGTKCPELNEDILEPPLREFEDVQEKPYPFPVLRFCGQLAIWTGNSTSAFNKVGISSTIMFESMVGEIALSDLELRNEGNTAIFYSWQKLTKPQTIPYLPSKTRDVNFYFNSSYGVICPGDTKHLEFVFKSDKPGIKTELWQLNTHPILLQGAPLHVTLKGMAMKQDTTADQRLYIEKKLERLLKVKTCELIVNEVMQGICTPDRPSSPAELYMTEEESFLRKNPGLQYVYQAVGDLKKMWQEIFEEYKRNTEEEIDEKSEVHTEDTEETYETQESVENEGKEFSTWDLSVETMRQVVLSLPDEEPSPDIPDPTPTRDERLAQLNSLFLDLAKPPEMKHPHLTAETIGRQLWRKLFDAMDDHASRLCNLLGLAEKELRFEQISELTITDIDATETPHKDARSEKKGDSPGKEEHSASKGRSKEDLRQESSNEEGRKRGRKKDDGGKHAKGKAEKESASVNMSDEQINESRMSHIYIQNLHKKVYAEMEDLVDNLCDLLEEINMETE